MSKLPCDSCDKVCAAEGRGCGPWRDYFVRNWKRDRRIPDGCDKVEVWRMTNESTQYIARISYGKDSLKMLDVIKSRGLPLDRITTTDVWATDTISANLPPMDQFKARMDQRIWDMYRIEVEHLCALNPDGTKKTYEQMFYHVPKRKNSQSVQVERERERENGSGPARSSDSRIYGTRGVKPHSSGVPMHRVQGNITGFPPNTRYNWCQKLKIPWGGI